MGRTTTDENKIAQSSLIWKQSASPLLGGTASQNRRAQSFSRICQVTPMCRPIWYTIRLLHSLYIPSRELLF